MRQEHRVWAHFVAVVAACTGTDLCAQASWSLPSQWTSRSDFAFAYDAARGVTILFGGADEALCSDTWQWDGTSWTELQPATHPNPRSRHVMAYDSLRQRILLFGGYDGVGMSNETWAFDGAQWSPVPTATAPPGSYITQVLTYDPVRDRMVLTGGTAGSYVYVWEFDGTDWTQPAWVLPTWPQWDSNFVCAYDPAAGNTALYLSNGAAGSMWRWNGANWTRQQGPGFYQVTASAMVHDPVRNRLLLVSGQKLTPSSPTMCVWNPVSAAWQPVATTGPEGGFARACFDAPRDRVVLVGAGDSSTWEWNGTQWNRRTFAPPLARHGHAMAYDRAQDRMFLYGGSNSRGDNGDLWVRTNGNWQLAIASALPSATHPGPLRDCRLVHDEARGETLLMASDGTTFPFWRFAGSQWQAINVTVPSPRGDPGVVYDRARQRVLLFGGSGVPYRNDTWSWNGTAWTELFPVHVPPGRDNPGIAYDPLRDRVVMLGGLMTSGVINQVWEFDGTDWQAPASATQVTPTNLPRLCWDEARQVTTAFLVPTSGAAQTWDWDGIDWRQGATSGPPVRYDAVLICDHDDVQLNGGRVATTAQGPVWHLASPSPATAEEFGQPGTSSVGPLALHTTGLLPWTGSTCTFSIGALPPLPLTGLWVGLSRTAWQGYALPLDLALVGYPGQMLYISPDGPWPVTNGVGVATAAFAIPAGAWAAGLTLHFQAAVYELLSARLTTSNGLTLTTGSR
ncbi:MAG: hypothetical protein U1E73_11325 [Planctomycetota bacterium]